jgi:hypothetical protein
MLYCVATTPCALSGLQLARPFKSSKYSFAAFHEFFNGALRADCLLINVIQFSSSRTLNLWVGVQMSVKSYFKMTCKIQVFRVAMALQPQLMAWLTL